MGIGRIASFLNSLSPSSDAASAALSADDLGDDAGPLIDSANGVQSNDADRQNKQSSDIPQQLQTMIAAVRQLTENAVQQGAAVAVSSAGSDLKNAVHSLGHLLASVDAQAMANGAATQIKQANDVVDAVESGILGTQAATEQLLRQMPPQQAQYAQETSQRFQSDMRQALEQVRGTLSTFQR